MDKLEKDRFCLILFEWIFLLNWVFSTSILKLQKVFLVWFGCQILQVAPEEN